MKIKLNRTLKITAIITLMAFPAALGYADCFDLYSPVYNCAPPGKPAKCGTGCVGYDYSPTIPVFCEALTEAPYCGWSQCSHLVVKVTKTSHFETPITVNNICIGCGAPSDDDWEFVGTCEADFIPDATTQCGYCDY